MYLIATFILAFACHCIADIGEKTQCPFSKEGNIDDIEHWKGLHPEIPEQPEAETLLIDYSNPLATAKSLFRLGWVLYFYALYPVIQFGLTDLYHYRIARGDLTIFKLSELLVDSSLPILMYLTGFAVFIVVCMIFGYYRKICQIRKIVEEKKSKKQK